MTTLWGRLRQAVTRPVFAIVLMVALLAVVLAYQFDTIHEVDVGGYYDRVYVDGFHEREQTEDGEQFRWTTASGTVSFPAVGARGYWLVLQMYGWRPAGEPSPEVTVGVNGHVLARTVVGPEWGEYLFWVPPHAAAATMRVTLETVPFVPVQAGTGGDPRPLGVAVRQVTLLSPGAGGFSPSWPPLDQLGWALLIAAALYLGLAAVGLPCRWSALVSVLGAAALGWGLAQHRLWTTIYSGRAAIVAWLGLLLLPLVGWLGGRIFGWGKVPFGEKELRLLLAIFLVGFWIKAAGLLYPYSVSIDLLWHLEKSQRITEGRLGELYQPGAFSESVMPVEWGEDRPMIPYSPFYHITAAAFFYLPWAPYDTANVVSVLLDTTKPFLIYFLALRLGFSRRAGLLAGLLYALLPANFLLHSWGNVPTQTGLWCTLASTCYIVGAWERLGKWRTWAGLTVFLLGTMLYYTVMAAFMVVFVGILLAGLGLNGLFWRGRPSKPLSLRPLGSIALALLVAIGLSTAIYYGQYARPIIEETIPHIRQSLAEGGVGLGKEPVPWSEYLGKHLVRLSSLRYGLIWPILLATGGLVIGWRHLRRPLLRWVLLAWYGTAFVFLLAGFYVDMVDKEIWYAMPALALCAAVALEWFWRRWPAGRALTVVTYLFLGAASLQTWVFRLATVKQDWLATDARIVGERVVQLVALAWRSIPWG